MRDNYVEGRLGLVIDGTGKDYSKITSQANQLKQIGYDVHMVFINTSLDVVHLKEIEIDLEQYQKKLQ